MNQNMTNVKKVVGKIFFVASVCGLSVTFTNAAFAQPDIAIPGSETEMMDSFDDALQAGGGMADFGAGSDSAVPLLARFIGHMRPSLDSGIGDLSEDTKLSDEQLEKIYQNKENFLDKLGPKMVELRSQERALRDVLMQTDIDKSKAQSIQNKINSLTGDIANLRLEKQLAVASVLTEEQRKEIHSSFLRRAGSGHCFRHGKKKSCPNK